MHVEQRLSHNLSLITQCKNISVNLQVMLLRCLLQLTSGGKIWTTRPLFSVYSVGKLHVCVMAAGTELVNL